MSFTVQLDIDITEHPDSLVEDKAIASMRRFYDVENLNDLEQIVANFGKISAALVEGEKLGVADA